MGLRAVCVGEEAFVDPRKFTLEGRPVRKLRQSVNRVQRRGWEITVLRGASIDTALELEIDQLEWAWRARRTRLHGFAMGMGPVRDRGSPGRPVRARALSRGPAWCRDALHLPLREALAGHDAPRRRHAERPERGLGVSGARERAQRSGVREVSLNYAGLAHLVRRAQRRAGTGGCAQALILAPLHRHFQMDRLVRFNEKFAPEWRPALSRVRVAAPHFRAQFYRTAGRGLPAAAQPAEAAEGLDAAGTTGDARRRTQRGVS